MAITKVKCGKCNHEWLPRSEKRPKQCPECGSASWDDGGGSDDPPPTFAEIRRWIPADLLKRVDATSEKLGMSFGDFVTEGLEERLKQLSEEKATAHLPISRTAKRGK